MFKFHANAQNRSKGAMQQKGLSAPPQPAYIKNPKKMRVSWLKLGIRAF